MTSQSLASVRRSFITLQFACENMWQLARCLTCPDQNLSYLWPWHSLNFGAWCGHVWFEEPKMYLVFLWSFWSKMKHLLLCEVNVEFSIVSHIHTAECEMVNLFNFTHLGPLSIRPLCSHILAPQQFSTRTFSLALFKIIS